MGSDMSEAQPFWEQPETVEMFAARDPDLRLLDLIGEYENPHEVRVLDLGCAGGRNTALLAERGFDVHAIDASNAMVERTRARVAEVLGATAAAERVRLGRMDDLSAFPADSFNLVVALGIFQSARTRTEWDRSVSETARILVPGGTLLVAHFTPRTDITGEGVHPVPGESHVYDGFSAGRMVLFEASALDAAMARHGLTPLVPSTTIEVPLDAGRRVTTNALYGNA